MTNVQWVRVRDLRPNNWYINGAKLARVREAWQRDEQDELPPVLVTTIDCELSLIDSHSRAYAAFEQGQTHIEAFVSDLAQIEGSARLYRHIHDAGPLLGVAALADLEDRIVEPAEHERLWIGYCSQWLEENKE